VAALPLPLQDFHLLAFASFAGRTHQYYALNVARVDGIDVCRLIFIVSVRGNMSMSSWLILEKSLFAGTYRQFHISHEQAITH
jgi:hypothetical protein